MCAYGMRRRCDVQVPASRIDGPKIRGRGFLLPAASETKGFEKGAPCRAGNQKQWTIVACQKMIHTDASTKRKEKVNNKNKNRYKS
ncbi:MAG TPA: hypothetical protein H9883_04385 [Candidatus Ruthenibacterium merdigallinarum]|nr:hypothetical protein [Candidatus Ruthenibacterium merdigallinarum]